MIHKMAVSLSSWCRNAMSMEEEERQIVQYGLEVLLDALIKTVVLLAIGCLLGCPGEFGLSLLAFCSLRYWAGGIHCRTSAGCLGAMLLLCIVSTYGGKVFLAFPGTAFGVEAVFSYLILLCIAPGLTKKSSEMSDLQRRRKRFGALVWVTMEYGIVLAIENVHLKWCIVIAIAMEVLSIIPCWKEQKGQRRETECSEKVQRRQ